MKTKGMLSRALSVGLFLFAASTTAFAAPGNFGERIGDGNGVPVYSNGTCGYVSGKSNYVDGKYMGMKWQCVEFARRYTYIKKGYRIPSNSYTASAKTTWVNAERLGLKMAKNGGKNRPRKNDLVFSTAGTYGHVGVITSAPANITLPGVYYVAITHQNWYTQNTTKTPKITRKLTVIKGTDGDLRYSLAGFDSSYPIAGWAWRQ